MNCEDPSMSNVGSGTSVKSSRSSNEKLVRSGKSHIGSEAALKNNDREMNNNDENDGFMKSS